MADIMFYLILVQESIFLCLLLDFRIGIIHISPYLHELIIGSRHPFHIISLNLQSFSAFPF
jgi:hypothetical protein